MTPNTRALLRLVRPGCFATLVSDDDGRLTRISLRGELDLAVVDALAGLGQRLPAPAASVELDLDAVSFLDSAGLGAVLGLREAVSDRGCDVRVRTPSSPGLTILRCARQLGWPVWGDGSSSRSAMSGGAA